ncbi:hypothetical protein CEXT_482381 [Caerostris extrusa]|uniref:Uncharacterized protein n=1 Tax=Caerostris extrusa TaxID=172846 RepID=A0AAV4UVX6_CAEEX|nr:hypothetical protein CEXT_482381 [Caerostris extrusa]
MDSYVESIGPPFLYGSRRTQSGISLLLVKKDTYNKVFVVNRPVFGALWCNKGLRFLYSYDKKLANNFDNVRDMYRSLYVVLAELLESDHKSMYTLLIGHFAFGHLCELWLLKSLFCPFVIV